MPDKTLSTSDGFHRLGPSVMAPKFSNDWCHFCGERVTGHIEVWWPENAEHEKKTSKPKTPNYVRVCKECVWSMARTTSCM